MLDYKDLSARNQLRSHIAAIKWFLPSFSSPLLVFLPLLPASLHPALLPSIHNSNTTGRNMRLMLGRGWKSENGIHSKVSAGLWDRMERSCLLSAMVSVCASAFIQFCHTVFSKIIKFFRIQILF